MRNSSITILFMLVWCHLQGQEMNYSFSHGSSTYQQLSDASTVAGGTSCFNNQSFRLPIGFSFSMCGKSFDSLTVEPNGFVKFDANRAIILYHGIGCKKDSNSVYSLLSYSVQGSEGAGIFKLQYSGFGYDAMNPAEYLHYQLWLYESGKIEIHTGATSYPGMIDSVEVSPTPLVGIINPLQDWSTSALLITGDASAPSSAPVGGGQELQYLQFVPPSNKVYSFIPDDNQ